MKKKYRLNLLLVEITRRCNKKCLHCFRGDAQDITISKQVIDSVFENIQDVQRVAFTGGEPLMEIEMIGYFMQKLIKSSWTTRFIEITTNGTVYDKQIIELFHQFCKQDKNNLVVMRISNDQFHTAAEVERAYEFYRPLVDAANNDLGCNERLAGISLEYTKEKGRMDSVNYEGRAVEYVNEHRGEINFHIPRIINHRIKIVRDTIPCALCISSNGDVGFAEEASYQRFDELSFGNICKESFNDLIEEHNENCMILCSETDYLRLFSAHKYYIGDSKLDWKHTVRMRAASMVYNQIIALRNKAQKMFPCIPAQVIIQELPFLPADQVNALLESTYPHTPFYTEKLLDNIAKYAGTTKEYNYKSTMYLAATNYWADRSIDRKYPYWLFGNENDISIFLIEKFAKIDSKCKGNHKKTRNRKNFVCEILHNGEISYEKDTDFDTWEKYKDPYGSLFISEYIDTARNQIKSLKQNNPEEWSDFVEQLDSRMLLQYELLPNDMKAEFTRDEMLSVVHKMVVDM